MIPLIDRYLFLGLLRGFVSLTLILACISWLVQALGFANDLLPNVQAPIDIALLSLLQFPNAVSMCLSPALMIATLAMLVRMLQNHEYFALTAAGLGPIRIMRPILTLAFIATLIQALLSFYISPLASYQFNRAKFEIRNNIGTIPIQAGTFKEVFPGITVFAEEQMSDGRWRDIVIHLAKSGDNQVTYLARRGQLLQGDSGPYLLLNGGVILDDTDARTQVSFSEHALILKNTVNQANKPYYLNKKDMMIHQLLNPQAYGVTHEPSIVSMRVKGFELLSNLATPFVLALIGFISITSAGLNRRGYGRRISLTVLLALIFQSGVIYSANLGATSDMTVLIFIWPTVCLAGILAIAYWRHRARMPVWRAANADT